MKFREFVAPKRSTKYLFEIKVIITGTVAIGRKVSNVSDIMKIHDNSDVIYTHQNMNFKLLSHHYIYTNYVIMDVITYISIIYGQNVHK